MYPSKLRNMEYNGCIAWKIRNLDEGLMCTPDSVYVSVIMCQRRRSFEQKE